jgi:hypothetical protein
MVDYAKEYGLDVDALMREAFWHPSAQWDNARIAERGEKFWEWHRNLNPEAPQDVQVKPARVRKKRAPRHYEFTDAQLAIAMRSIRESR